jgi:phosphomannomutase
MMNMTLMVGVSGVRGIVGESLTPQVVLEFAQAYGTLLAGGRVVLARDPRPSGVMFEAAAAAGLLAAGCPVTRLGVVTTPTAGRAITDGGYAGGMIITASHNPREWNGLKFLDDLGVAPDPQRAARIAEIRTTGAFRPCRTDTCGHAQEDPGAGQRHVAAVLAAQEVDLRAVQGLRVVLDSVNGAGCRDTPNLMTALGCEFMHLNSEPTGEFAHRPEPIRENLTALCDAVRQKGAAIGFAQDPDADRLAIVDERGEYIGEEYTLALAVWSVLSRRPGPVAANLSTSRMVDDLAARYGAQVIRTPVGEAHVARAMRAHHCVIGGEGNGGVIDPRICWVRDSFSAISLVLQLIAATRMSVSTLVSELPAYAMIKEKFEIPRERIQTAVEAVTKAFSGRAPLTADGVRVDFPEGWVHLRASNTEPIMRVFAEAADAARATALVKQVRSAAGI